MKMSKTILPALAMLLVSAVMLSTASFAWFALSETVTANNMTVSIKSDSLYLLIAAVNDETAGGADKVETAVLTAQQLQTYKTGDSGEKVGSTSAEGYAIGETDIYPAAFYQKDGFMGKDNSGDRTVGVTKGTDLANAAIWYTATAQNADTSGMITDSDKPLTSFDGYVVRYRYYVTLDKGSNPMDILRISNLSITDAQADDGTVLDPVTVVVACGDAMEVFSGSGTKTGTVDLTGTAQITDATAYEIILYVFYNGNNDKVTTNDVAALSDAAIDFKLVAENAAASN